MMVLIDGSCNVRVGGGVAVSTMISENLFY